MDPELAYDGGWDGVEDDHALSDWHIGLDSERNEHHPGHHHDGRFARDRVPDLTSPAGVPDTTRPDASAVPAATPEPDGRPRPPRLPLLNPDTATALRAGLAKEAKSRRMSEPALWTERQQRLAAGEAIPDILRRPPAQTSAPATREDVTVPDSQGTRGDLPPDVENALRVNLNVETKFRRVPKAEVWNERITRYRNGEPIDAIVKLPPGARQAVRALPPKRAKRSKGGIRSGSPTPKGRFCRACGAREENCRC